MTDTATATVEEVQLLKTLRWWDGFIIALCNPGFLLGSLGFTLGIFGVVGSMILWGASAAIGMSFTVCMTTGETPLVTGARSSTVPPTCFMRPSRKIRLLPSVDLPQPDSPAKPMISPSAIEKLTPSTALTSPRNVR